MSNKAEYVAAIDLGHAHTRAAIAEAPAGGTDDGTRLRLLGVGEAPSNGWIKGNLVDMEAAVASVRDAVAKAEQMADGLVIESAVIGTGGSHLHSIGSHDGMLLSHSQPREVANNDVLQLMDEVRSVPLAADREIIHVLPREFVLDSRGGIRDPVGLLGIQLAVHGYVLTGSAAVGRNLVAAVNRASVMVETVAAESYAVGEAAPSVDERTSGVMAVVIGGASSEMIVYRHGGVVMSASIAVGGDHFTNDLMIGLHTARADAESIKQTFGAVTAGWRHTGTTFEVPELGRPTSRLIQQSLLREILEARGMELFSLVLSELRHASLPEKLEEHLEAGIVLCGGGANLPGMCDLAERVLLMPARIGLPPRVLGLPESLDAPQYTVLLSLLHYALRVRRHRAPQGSRSASPWKHLFDWKK